MQTKAVFRQQHENRPKSEVTRMQAGLLWVQAITVVLPTRKSSAISRTAGQTTSLNDNSSMKWPNRVIVTTAVL